MSNTFLSRFTPSLTPPEILEAMLVGRESELERVINLIRESVTTPSKHHVLLIGPRGIGKTHLISLINHRLGLEPELQDKMLIVWLKEEEWGVSSFLDLLLRILRRLAESNTPELPAAEVELLFDVAPEEAEIIASELLKRVSSGRTLILLAENLDEIFDGLGERGQQKLRSFIQGNPFLSIVATTQSLFPSVTLQSEPFYGFFRLYHLSQLSFDEAVTLLIKIAKLNRNDELAAYLKTLEGRARVRAVHHLVGGNHRLYIIFSEFLSRSSVEDLVTPFMRMLDELTPYYQERMRWLSPQKRQIVEILCDVGKPLQVKEIARQAFITQQTASAQLKQLRDDGYVDSKQLGRESLYELREPLMRLTVEVKKNRGEPIRLLVEFLRIMYSPDEIESRLNMMEGVSPSLEHTYLSYALKEVLSDSDDPRIKACKEDYNSFVEKYDIASALNVAEELIAIKRSFSNWFLKWSCAESLGLSDAVTEAAEKLKQIAPKDANDWYFRGEYYLRRNSLRRAANSFEKAVQLKPDMGAAWKLLTFAFIKLSNYEKALNASTHSVELMPNNTDNWQYRGHIFANLENFNEARAAYEKVIELAPDSSSGWMNMGWMHCRFQKFADALPFMEKAVALAPLESNVLTNRGWALAGLKRYEEALRDFDRALELNSNNVMAFTNRGWSLIELDKYDEALKHFERYSQLYPNDPAAWEGLGQVFYFLNRYEESLHMAERALQLNKVSPTAWSLQGAALSLLGKHGGALLSFDRALKYGDHTSITLFYRAVGLLAIRKWDEGFKELDHAFYHSCRTHGFELRGVMHLFKLIYEQYEENWSNLIPRVIETYLNNHLASRLGAGLVKFLFKLVKEDNGDKTGRWVSVWQSFIQQYPQLEISSDLLDVAWRYSQTKEESVLWALPSEERKIIETFWEGS